MPKAKKLKLSTYQRKKGSVVKTEVNAPKDKSLSGEFIGRHSRDFWKAAGMCANLLRCAPHSVTPESRRHAAAVRQQGSCRVELSSKPSDLRLQERARDLFASRLNHTVVDQALKQDGVRLWVAATVNNVHTVRTLRCGDRGTLDATCTPAYCAQLSCCNAVYTARSGRYSPRQGQRWPGGRAETALWKYCCWRRAGRTEGWGRCSQRRCSSSMLRRLRLCCCSLRSKR